MSDHKMACMSVLGTAVMGSMVPFQHCCEDPEVSLNFLIPNPLKASIKTPQSVFKKKVTLEKRLLSSD